MSDWVVHKTEAICFVIIQIKSENMPMPILIIKIFNTTDYTLSL